MNAKIQYGSARPLTFTATRRRLADPTRFPRLPYTSRTYVFLASTAVVAITLLAAVPREVPDMALALAGGAWLAVVLVLTLPSASETAGVELSRRLGGFRDAVNAVGDHPSRDDLERLLALARDLGLHEHEIADEISRIRASLEALRLQEQLARGEWPVVGGVDALPPGDVCHFMGPVRFGRRRSDQYGHLLLTSGWLRFRGALDLSVAWSEASSVQRAGREVIVTLRDSHRALRFGCHTVEEAIRASVIAEHLADAHLMLTRGTPLAH